MRRFRRFLIQFLVGRMEVCMNMRIWGEVEYSGRHGGVIFENNHCIEGSERITRPFLVKQAKQTAGQS